MTLSAARRRRIDRIVAAAIAVAVVAVGVVVYLTSEIRATASTPGPASESPDAPTTVPTSLTQAWALPTEPTLGAVASPYGVVITADATTVTGHDAVTGDVRWSYSQTDQTLCAIGSGDTDAPGVTNRGKVRGVMAVWAKNGYCSQVILLDPATGERHYYRTSPNQLGGSLAFGGPYAAWLGPSLLELWRDDLVRTIQYGELPAPPKPNARHLGCTFTDIALADQQFATVEHCTGSPNARLVINWATPDSAPDKPDGQDVFQHEPRADFDTGAPAARIVGITQDRVAVLVSAPTPAVVVYDTSGVEMSRSTVDVPADAIVTADQLSADGATLPTPAVRDGSLRYSLVGDTLLAVSNQSAEVTATPTTTSTSTSASFPLGAAPPTVGVLADDTSTAAAPAETLQVRDLSVAWTKSGARGLPAVVGDQLLMPVDGGLAAVIAANGNPGTAPASISIDRGGYQGRVDATAVGPMIIETRGDQVVGLT